jgi:group I intron endonuclease
MKIKETWKKQIGIYCIKNVLTNKCYIGSSINIGIRLSKHKSQLKHNKHFNSYLQNSWNKYGEDYFSCFILEYCKSEELLDKEQSWVNILGDYNITKDVIRNIPSEESKKKMSLTRTTKIASGEIAKNNTKKIKKYDLNGTFIKEYNTITEASIENNISSDQIRRVLKKIHKTAKGFQWKYSDDEFEIQEYKGRDYTETSLKKQKSVIVLDTYTGIYEEFNSYKECGDFFNKTFQTISRALKNKRNLYKNRYLIQDLVKSCELMETPEVDNHEPRLIEI